MPVPTILREAVGAIARILSPREQRWVVSLILLLVVGVVWGATAFLLQRTEAVPRAGGTYREGIVGQPRYLVPMLARTNDADMAVSRLVYSGLLKLTSHDALEGDLAESVEVSEDGKVYTAHLRDGVQWHDGEPFTADDVVYTVQTIQNPSTKSPAAPSFEGVTVEKVDDRTVRFTLREPYAPFLYTLTTGIAPAHLWSAVEPQNIALAEQTLKPIGTGPFRFTKLRKRSLGEVLELSFARYEKYHGGHPFLDGITFTFFESYEDLLRAFQRRSVDGMSFVPPSLVAETEKFRHARLVRVKLPQVFAIFMNQTRNASLADPAVRSALDLATDRDRLIREALRGEGVRADAPIPQGFLGYVEDLGRATFDLGKAQQNLEEAGWKDLDGDGVREKGDFKLAFSIATTDSPEYVQTAELLAESWRAMGAAVTVDSKTVGTVQTEVIRPRNYDALLYGEVLGADPDPYPFWHSTQTRDPGVNLALYRDREADKLLETARKTTDVERRSETYKKFQERLLQSHPAVFLYSPLYTYALSTAIRGELLSALPLPAERFTTVSSWSLRTKRVWK